MRGYRNKEDLLWDIPVTNPDLLKSKHTTQPNKSGLYSVIPNKKYTPAAKSPRTSMFNYKKAVRSKQYDNIFESFNDIIDHNEFLNTITAVKKQECQKSPNHKLSVIIRKNQTKHELATFLIAACFNPVRSTLLQAIRNNHFTTWPGMDYKFMSKHLTENINSAKGHLNQERQGLQSTKVNLPKLFDEPATAIASRIEKLKLQYPNIQGLKKLLETDILDDAFPLSDSPNKNHMM